MNSQELYTLYDDIAQKTVGKSRLVKKVAAEVNDLIKNELKRSLPEAERAIFEDNVARRRALHEITELVADVSTSNDASRTLELDKLQGLLKKASNFVQGEEKRVYNKFLEKMDILAPGSSKMIDEVAEKASSISLVRSIGDKSGSYNFTTLQKGGLISGIVAGKVGKKVNEIIAGASLIPKELLDTKALELASSDPKLATFLKTLSQSDNVKTRQALMFSAMQRPEMREKIKKLFGLEDDD
jgi:hypothetical protein